MSMGRTPLPTDTIERSVNFPPAINQHLGEVTERLRRSFSDAVNSEVDFLRTCGLTPSRLRRLAAAAAAEKMELQEYVKGVLREAAKKLPAKSGGPERAPTADRRRGGIYFTGPNGAFILNKAVESGREFIEVLNAQLEFARTYGLHADLLAAIDAFAAASGETRRDVVLNILRTLAESLPEVEEKPTRTRRK